MIQFFFICFFAYTDLGKFDIEWQMDEISLLIDAVSQLDEPFLLVIVVIVCWTSTNSGSTDLHWY